MNEVYTEAAAKKLEIEIVMPPADSPFENGIVETPQGYCGIQAENHPALLWTGHVVPKMIFQIRIDSVLNDCVGT